MTDSLIHRGPDGSGHFFEETGECAIALGSRRLAIVDPGPASDQPLHYMQRYVIVHNGEIYNAPTLRRELIQAGLSFRSAGDAEVIAAAYHIWGSNCVEHFKGMFAFAIWDREKESLYAARDRFGEKPFHFHYDDREGLFHFASEMKALWAAGINRKPLNQAFLHFLTLGITEHPELPELTFYEGILRLPPAHYLLFHPGTNELSFNRYWDLDKVSQRESTIEDSINRFQVLFQSSVDLMLQADANIGIALSGGIDSGSIAARAKNKVLETVSAVFPGFIKDETESICSIAGHFSMNVHLVQPDASMLLEGLDTIVHHQEEPFGSTGILAQYAVHGRASALGMRVLLDGQGADELLGGYERYTQWHLLEVIREKGWNAANTEAKALSENGFLPSWNWKNRLSAFSPELTATWLERKTRQVHDRLDEIDIHFRERNDGAGFIHKPLVQRLNDILYSDCLTGPLQTLLRYADRNAMAHGIETRFPFLDHQLAEFIFSLPGQLKYRSGFNKWVLRESHRSMIDEKIIWRRGKTGFEPPQFAWMKDERIKIEIKRAHEKLVDIRMLHPKVMPRDVIPCHAYQRDNRDWRYWIAAQFI